MNIKCIAENSEELLAEPLFLNNNFKIDKKTFLFPEWINKNITSVGALVKENGSFKTLIEIMTEFDFAPKPLENFGCRSVIKESAKRTSITLKSDKVYSKSKTVSLLTSALKGSKPIYNALIGKAELSNACKKWEKYLEKEINWEKIFIQINKIKETKLRWFQLKICYRVLVTNSILNHMNITDSNECNFCQSEKDTIFHHLWKCNHVQTFWIFF